MKAVLTGTPPRVAPAGGVAAAGTQRDPPRGYVARLVRRPEGAGGRRWDRCGRRYEVRRDPRRRGRSTRQRRGTDARGRPLPLVALQHPTRGARELGREAGVDLGADRVELRGHAVLIRAWGTRAAHAHSARRGRGPRARRTRPPRRSGHRGGRWRCSYRRDDHGVARREPRPDSNRRNKGSTRVETRTPAPGSTESRRSNLSLLVVGVAGCVSNFLARPPGVGKRAGVGVRGCFRFRIASSELNCRRRTEPARRGSKGPRALSTQDVP